VGVDGFDQRPCARHGRNDVAQQVEIGAVAGVGARRDVHQLHRQIDELRRRIGVFRGHDVFFAQDRDVVAVDQEPRALIGVGDHAGADDDSLVRLEFDFQGHPCSPLPCVAGMASRVFAGLLSALGELRK